MPPETNAGVALPGYYTQLTHDRHGDYWMMENMNVQAVVILQPDWNKVVKVKKAVPNAKIILRVWDWDDGRTEQNPDGVYRYLQNRPALLGREHANKFRDLLVVMRNEADRNNEEFPPDEDFICHLVNEPDTNQHQLEISLYTIAAIEEAAKFKNVTVIFGCFNFGTGHPADLVAGPGSDVKWQPYMNALTRIRELGHWVFLHEYYNETGITDPSVNPWHINRHKFAPLQGCNVAITEWGLEQLVNHMAPDHHGWNGILSPKKFSDDYEWYCTQVAPFVKWVCIFASDLPDRKWNSFDTVPASQELVRASTEIWKKYNDQGKPDPIDPIEPPMPKPIVFPIRDSVISQRFGENQEYYQEMFGIPGHNGIDLVNSENDPVYSVFYGHVEWVDYDQYYGRYVRIWHPGLNCHSFYAHLNEVSVRGGEEVNPGDQIGLLGNTGNSTGAHLHFEFRMGQRYQYWDIHEGYRNGRVNPETIYASFGLRF